MKALHVTPTQLTLALVALAIAAFVAVVLAAGTGPATAGSFTANDTTANSVLPQQATQTPEPTATPTPTPRHASPEPCPGQTGNPNATADRVVDSGHIALFDVWWNPVEGELTNNLCPPMVTHVPEVPGDELEGIEPVPARDDRSPSSIDITAEPPTIIHIPLSAKINLSDSTTHGNGNRTYAEMFTHLVTVDNSENRDTNNDGTPDGVGDGIVWALPACPPAGSPAPGGLCLSFSAALLNAEDWQGDTVDYDVTHVHQLDIDRQDARFVLVYDVPEASAQPSQVVPLWNSHDSRAATVSVDLEGYNRPLWFFTDRGTYEFQVYIQGDPQSTLGDDPKGTSDEQKDIIHVGAEADLGVTATMTPESPSPADEVTVTVTASNAGPDEAQETKVDVTLPAGLTYSSHAPANDTFTESDGVRTWNVGSLASGASKTLTVRATVDAETHGRELTVGAAIHATERVQVTETRDNVTVLKTYHAPVPDPVPGNNAASDTITVSSVVNTAPVFRVVRSVAENSAAATAVGDPIPMAYDPDTGDTLTYSLTGTGANLFDVAANAEGNPQVSVATGADLDYETTTSYSLRLNVSDGKDDYGNTNSAIDHFIGLLVNVTDEFDHVTLQVTENAAPGTAVGAVVPLAPDSGASYSLSGTGSDKFAVTAVEGGAQLSVATGAIINYEDDASFALTLTATTSTVSKEISVTVDVQDEANEQIVVTLSADRTTQVLGSQVHLTTTVTNSPYPSRQLTYRLYSHKLNETTETPFTTSRTFTVERAESKGAATVNYEVNVYHWGPDILAVSNRVAINWVNP